LYVTQAGVTNFARGPGRLDERNWALKRRSSRGCVAVGLRILLHVTVDWIIDSPNPAVNCQKQQYARECRSRAAKSRGGCRGRTEPSNSQTSSIIAKPLATRNERKHQPLAATLSSQENRPFRVCSIRIGQNSAAAKSTPAKDFTFYDSCE